jgi:hypothetical protein
MTTVKMLAKWAMTAVAPQTATVIMSARARAHSQRLARQWGLIDLNRRLVSHLGAVVQAGPFRGMALTPMTHDEHLGPYLLGTYESELHPWIEHLTGRRFRQVLDVGSKFGYYAVGLALRLPWTPIVAFDPDPWARKATEQMIAANGTSLVTVEPLCSAVWLDQYLAPNSLIVSDCEGFEGELFPSATTSALDSSTLIVEIHDNLIPGVGRAVRDRFARTHAVAVVTNRDHVEPSVDLSFLTPEDAASAAREIRGPQEWLLFAPLDSRR